RAYDVLKILRVRRQSRRPNRPVELSIVSSIVERQAVDAHMRLIEGHLFLRHILRKQMKPEDAIPYEVIFLAPRAGLVKGQPIVIPIRRQLYPIGGHALRGASVL